MFTTFEKYISYFVMKLNLIITIMSSKRTKKPHRIFEYIENMYAYSSMIIRNTYASNNSNLSMLSSHEMRYSSFSPTGIHMSTCQYL